ncbi:hypothetical protein PINS_up012481 [Pythium insidiosum]|nr:hypothetical protein PINS_up012481 [Pythium insidiosum]
MPPFSSEKTPAWIKVVGAIAIVLHIVAMCLVCVSWSGGDLRTVSATANERVSPTAIFKGLRVGSSATCVTLHQVMNETGRWRTLETCNDLHLGEDHNLLSLRDAQTGQRLTVDPICKAEQDWLAEKMGIPSRVDIVRVWDKQCKGSSTVDTLMLLFSTVSVSLAGAFALITVLLDDAAKWWFWVSGDHAVVFSRSLRKPFRWRM